MGGRFSFSFTVLGGGVARKCHRCKYFFFGSYFPLPFRVTFSSTPFLHCFINIAWLYTSYFFANIEIPLRIEEYIFYMRKGKGWRGGFVPFSNFSFSIFISDLIKYFFRHIYQTFSKFLGSWLLHRDVGSRFFEINCGGKYQLKEKYFKTWDEGSSKVVPRKGVGGTRLPSFKSKKK